MNHPEIFATYDSDFFAWTQAQADALRALPEHGVGSAVDITHVAEEIEDLGKRELREVKSLLSRVVYQFEICTPMREKRPFVRGV